MQMFLVVGMMMHSIHLAVAFFDCNKQSCTFECNFKLAIHFLYFAQKVTQFSPLYFKFFNTSYINGFFKREADIFHNAYILQYLAHGTNAVFWIVNAAKIKCYVVPNVM
jgi:hypothetical protein